MKTGRLIKAQMQNSTLPMALTLPPPVLPPTREAVTAWVREYQATKPLNPRAEFAKLFKAAA